MPSRDLPRLAEEAIRDIAPYDVSQQMAAHIRDRLPAQKKQARARQQAVINRADLATAIVGDAEGCRAIAAAYASALHGFEITSGRDEQSGPVINTVKWIDLITDAAGNPLPFSKALDRLYAAKSDAEGGVLVIEDIYDAPRNANPTAAEQAKNGALQMLHDLMEEYAEKDYTPVIVLTGAPDRMDEFFRKNPGVAQYFAAESILAGSAPQQPAPPVNVALSADVSVRLPIRLKTREP